MPVGAEDYLDQMLVEKYAAEQIDNHDSMVSAVEPEKMMSTMNSYANMSRNMFLLNQTLNNSCLALKSRSAIYKKAAIMEGFMPEYIEDRSVA